MVPIDAPTSVCEQFKCFNVCITVEGTQLHASIVEWNAFEVMMLASREMVLVCS